MIIQSMQIAVSLLLIFFVPIGLGYFIPKRQNYLAINYFLGTLVLNFIFLLFYKTIQFFDIGSSGQGLFNYNYLTVLLFVAAGFQLYRNRTDIKLKIQLPAALAIISVFAFFNFVYGTPMYHNIFSNIHFLKSAEEIFNYNIFNPLTADSYLPTLQILFYLGKFSGIPNLVAVNFFLPLLAAFLFYDVIQRIFSWAESQLKLNSETLSFSAVMALVFLFKFINLNANNLAFLGLLIGLFELSQTQSRLDFKSLGIQFFVFAISIVYLVILKRIDGFIGLVISVLVFSFLFKKQLLYQYFIFGALIFVHRVSLINVGFVVLLGLVVHYRLWIRSYRSVGIVLAAIFFVYLTYRYEYLIKAKLATFKVMSNIPLKVAEWVRLVPMTAFLMAGFVFIKGGFRSQLVKPVLLTLFCMLILTFSVLSEFMRITSAVVFVFSILFCFEYGQFILKQATFRYSAFALIFSLAVSVLFKLRGDFASLEHTYFRMVLYTSVFLFLLAIYWLVLYKNKKHGLYFLSFFVFSFDIFYTTNRYHSFTFGEHRTVNYPITQMTPEIYQAAKELKQFNGHKKALLIGDPVVISGLKALTGYNSFFYYENVSDFSNMNYRNEYYIFLKELQKGIWPSNFEKVYSAEAKYVFKQIDCDRIFYVDTFLLQNMITEFDPNIEKYFPFNPSRQFVKELDLSHFVIRSNQPNLKIYQLSQAICNQSNDALSTR